MRTWAISIVCLVALMGVSFQSAPPEADAGGAGVMAFRGFFIRNTSGSGVPITQVQVNYSNNWNWNTPVHGRTWQSHAQDGMNCGMAYALNQTFTQGVSVAPGATQFVPCPAMQAPVRATRVEATIQWQGGTSRTYTYQLPTGATMADFVTTIGLEADRNNASTRRVIHLAGAYRALFNPSMTDGVGAGDPYWDRSRFIHPSRVAWQ